MEEHERDQAVKQAMKLLTKGLLLLNAAGHVIPSRVILATLDEVTRLENERAEQSA